MAPYCSYYLFIWLLLLLLLLLLCAEYYLTVRDDIQWYVTEYGPEFENLINHPEPKAYYRQTEKYYASQEYLKLGNTGEPASVFPSFFSSLFVCLFSSSLTIDVMALYVCLSVCAEQLLSSIDNGGSITANKPAFDVLQAEAVHCPTQPHRLGFAVRGARLDYWLLLLYIHV
jgi:hypothetical protein